MKKNFRRKLARVFGLALRSDLERVNEAYEWEQEEHEFNAAQSSKYRKLWRDTQKAYEVLVTEIAELDVKLEARAIVAKERKLVINRLGKKIKAGEEEIAELKETLTAKDECIEVTRRDRDEALKQLSC